MGMRRVCLFWVGLCPIWVWAALFIISEQSVQLNAAQDWIRVLERARESVVSLNYPAAPNATCTGFIFGRQRQYVVTARHCVVEDGKAYETRVGDRVLSIVKDYQPEELFLLRLAPGLAFQTAALQLGDRPKVGQEVAALGFFGSIPGIATATFLTVSVASQSFHSAGPPNILFSGHVMRGMSGGPILDRAGRVVSLVVCNGIADSSGLACGTRWEVLKQLPQD